MDEDKARFEVLYAATYEPILGYALRRCSSPHDAADVVAETFGIAWRRFADIPDGESARLWLYGVARRVLANHRRGERQRHLHLTNLREEIAEIGGDPLDAPVIGEVFRELSGSDQELLALVAWEGLDHAEIAIVLGLSRGAVRVRLHRARTRFSRGLRRAGVEIAPFTAARHPVNGSLS